MNSKTRENSLWQWLRKAERTFGSRLHWRRVENKVGSGDPDVEACLNSRSFNLELKAVPRTAMIETGLMTHQVQWGRARHQAGGSAFVLVQVGSGPGALRYLVYSCDAERLVNQLPETELLRLSLVDPGANPEEIVLRCSLGGPAA